MRRSLQIMGSEFAPDGRIRFWSPVRNSPDVFIHFIIFRDPPQ
jgi:hypothetical protein